MMDRVKRLIRDVDAWTLRHRLPRITRRAILGFLEHEALTHAGSMAYFGVLSLFQLLVLGVVVLSYILGEGAARVSLEMPLLGDDFGEEPVELRRIVDQVGEQVAQVPIEQHAADVEDDG